MTGFGGNVCYHRRMKFVASLFICVVILLNTALGLRGLWQQSKNFGSMHPFSDPVVDCRVHAYEERGGVWYALPLPRQLYRNLLGSHFVSRFYLEQVPYFNRGLTQLLGRVHPQAQVQVDCIPLYGLLPL